MSLTDVPQPNWTDTQLKTIRVRELLSNVVGHADSALHQVRNVIRGHRTAIATELGDDAAALLTTYAKLKEAVETAKEITVEDIPNG